jgi:hypothetical protein
MRISKEEHRARLSAAIDTYAKHHPGMIIFHALATVAWFLLRVTAFGCIGAGVVATTGASVWFVLPAWLFTGLALDGLYRHLRRDSSLRLWEERVEGYMRGEEPRP